MHRYINRVALITAAGSGLGRGVALRLAEEGGTVIIWDRDEKLLAQSREQAEKKGVTLDTQLVDMTHHKAITEGIDTLVAKHRRIDVLVNNIGGSLHTPFHFLEQTDDHWKMVMDVNVTTCVRTTRAVLPYMLQAKYGRIINMGSKAGRYGSLFAGANYAASKGAMQAFTLQIAQEFGPHGITCNSVCPGAIMTERVQGLIAERQSPEERKRVINSIPVRRHGKVEDVAGAIAYLASEEAGFITGVALDVNGGQAMSL